MRFRKGVLISAELGEGNVGTAHTLRRPFEEIPLLRHGLIAVMILWVLGFALNDSGAAIPAVGATLACPLVIALAIRTFDDEWESRPVTSRASRHRR